MPKKDEVKVPKKVKDKMTEEIIEEISGTVKDDVKESVVNDIKKSFDQDFKNEIKTTIKEELIEDIKKDISREQKKVSRSKSFKIFRLYIYLIIVVGALLYLLFRMYETDTLTVIDKSYTRRPTSSRITTTTEEITEVVKDGEYYINNYGYLMDNVKISNTDLVKSGVYISEMNINDKLSLAYANLDDSKIIVDGIIHTIAESDLQDAYLKAFGTVDGYLQNNFSVNGLNYAYSSSNNSYIAVGEEEENAYIQNLLIDGRDDGGAIILEAKSYVIKNNAIYSPNNMSYRIMNVTEDMDISKIQNRLLTVEYRFENNGNGYRLVSIQRK